MNSFNDDEDFTTPIKSSFSIIDNNNNNMQTVYKKSPSRFDEEREAILEFYETKLNQYMQEDQERQMQQKIKSPSTSSMGNSAVVEQLEEEIFSLQDTNKRLESELKKSRKELRKIRERTETTTSNDGDDMPVKSIDNDEIIRGLSVELEQMEAVNEELMEEKIKIERRLIEITDELERVKLENAAIKRENETLETKSEIKSQQDEAPNYTLFSELTKATGGTMASVEYVSLLEQEVETLRQQLKDAWQKWDMEHQDKENLKQRLLQQPQTSMDEFEEDGRHEQLLHQLGDFLPLVQTEDAEEMAKFYQDYQENVENFMKFANELLTEYHQHKQRYKKRSLRLQKENEGLVLAIEDANQRSAEAQVRLENLLSKLKCIGDIEALRNLLNQFDYLCVTENQSSQTEFTLFDTPVPVTPVKPRSTLKRKSPTKKKIIQKSPQKVTIITSNDSKKSLLHLLLLFIIFLSLVIVSSMILMLTFRHDSSDLFQLELPGWSFVKRDLVDAYEGGQRYAFPM